MNYAAQSEAKRFFVERVREQAAHEGIDLSKAEIHDLNWSESDPGFVPDIALSVSREQQMSDEDFEAKIARLIDAAYNRDIKQDRAMKARYREARAVLAEGDHYLSIMIDRGLGMRASRWWPF